ncbi:unnamed protein product [Didymodactylos carnosus]|uniref:Uncharacterized protein n=1 Tax=Didymodactylos carnosus TaxID=1234261 RepID=A0A814FR54_9BILA|nr:unnamed protein product [Didymodactylos carnosus]CAF0983643.1 unnamed protein product [Didymodactylos carnosus]CAF3562544.1 unnamed protein product [Didymodactylos carnosus]CAF3756015.1 unnamed protein product [Didymodactylos carnosus]
MMKFPLTTNVSSPPSLPLFDISKFYIRNNFAITIDGSILTALIFLFHSRVIVWSFINGLTSVLDIELSDYTIVYSTIVLSYLLVLDSNNNVYIYSIETGVKQCLFKTIFDSSVYIHSFEESFYILDSCHSTLSKIVITADGNPTLIYLTELKFEYKTMISTVTQSKLAILADNYSSLALYDMVTQTLEYISTADHLLYDIRKIYGMTNNATIILHDNTNHFRIWNTETNVQPHIKLGYADIYDLKTDRFVKYKRNTTNGIHHQLVTYDLNRKLRGQITIKSKCDKLCLNESGTYLFVIDKDTRQLYMFRIEDGKQIGKLFIENIREIRATNDYLIISKSNTLLVTMIADPKLENIHKIIQTLPSRSESDTVRQSLPLITIKPKDWSEYYCTETKWIIDEFSSSKIYDGRSDIL